MFEEEEKKKEENNIVAVITLANLGVDIGPTFSVFLVVGFPMLFSPHVPTVSLVFGLKVPPLKMMSLGQPTR